MWDKDLKVTLVEDIRVVSEMANLKRLSVESCRKPCLPHHCSPIL